VTSYILTLREADTQLRDLVKRTQTTHKPVVLTAEGTAEPVALLVEANEYALPNGDSVADLATHLNKLEQLLDLLDTLWQVEAVRQPFPSAWRWRLEGIWHASRQRERPFRQLVILLQMAADNLEMARFTRADLALWRECVQILQQATVTRDDLIRCDEALIQHNFPVLLDFDPETVALYVTNS